MILADTSVWVGHLRYGDAELSRLLEAGRILTHPFVIGELALGSPRKRDLILSSLRDLPHVTTAMDEEVLVFVDGKSCLVWAWIMWTRIYWRRSV